LNEFEEVAQEFPDLPGLDQALAHLQARLAALTTP
jgi:hypothetical protein